MFLDHAPERWQLADRRRRLVLVPIGRFDLRASTPLDHSVRVPARERRAVHVATDEIAMRELAATWMRAARPCPLHVVDNEGGVPKTLSRIVERELASTFDEVVVIVGRLELRRPIHRLLHDRSADAIGRTVAPIPGALIAVMTVGTT